MGINIFFFVGRYGPASRFDVLCNIQCKDSLYGMHQLAMEGITPPRGSSLLLNYQCHLVNGDQGNLRSYAYLILSLSYIILVVLQHHG